MPLRPKSTFRFFTTNYLPKYVGFCLVCNSPESCINPNHSWHESEVNKQVEQIQSVYFWRLQGKALKDAKITETVYRKLIYQVNNAPSWKWRTPKTICLTKCDEPSSLVFICFRVQLYLYFNCSLGQNKIKEKTFCK